MLKRNLIAILILGIVFISNAFGQGKGNSNVPRYNKSVYQRLDKAESSILSRAALKADVAKNPDLASQVYEVTAKVMAMNTTGKLQYVQFSTQCLVDEKVITKAEKTDIDSLLSYMLNNNSTNTKRILEQLKRSDNVFVKALVDSISNSNNQGTVAVQSGAEIGGAIGTIVGAVVGGYFGGVAGAIGGATLGGKVGAAIGKLVDGLFGGKNKGDDGDGGDGNDDTEDDGGGGGDDSGGSGGSEASKAKPKTSVKWITVDSSKWKFGNAPY